MTPFQASPLRYTQLLDAANLFADARRERTPISSLPPELTPTSIEESFYIQDQLIRSYGSVGGYKVGAPTAEAEPIFCPMPLAWMAASPATFSGIRMRGLEAEIAFLLGHDLPPRATPYSDEEVYAAVASCHPAIEILESALDDPLDPDQRLLQIADLQMHGGFVYGEPFAAWRAADWSREHIMLAVEGSVRVERTGSNTSGDLRRLLPWLANHGSIRTGGLRAGQWITTGSWTGVTLAAGNSAADAHFSSAGTCAMRFS